MNKRQFVLAIIWLFSSFLLQAQTVLVEDVMVRQQWKMESQFLDTWTEIKSTDESDLVRNLLEAHVINSANGPILKDYPGKEGFRQDINQSWINEASNALYNNDLENAAFYLTQLSPPLTAIEEQWVSSLKMSVLLSQGDIETAEILKNNSQLSEFFLELVTIQTAEALIVEGKYKTIAENLEKFSVNSAALDLRKNISLSLSLQELGTKRGRRFLDSVGIDHPARARLLGAQLNLATKIKDDDRQLEILLELTSYSNSLTLSQDQVKLLRILKQRSALFQLIELGNLWSKKLVDSRVKLLEEKNILIQPDFFAAVSNISIEETGSDVYQQLNSDEYWIVEELARINSVSALMDKNLEQLFAYSNLLKKGSAYVVNELKIFPDVLPSQTTDYPEYIINRGPEVLLFERLLTRFIGTPEEWEHRYTYLDGLSMWHTGKPFRNPWWKDDQASIRKATIELRRLMSKRKKLIEQLNEKRWNSTKIYMDDLINRTKSSLNKLKTAKEALSADFETSLTLRFDNGLSDIDQDILWLANFVFPNADLIDRQRIQPYFILAPDENKTGHVLLQVKESELEIKDTTYIFQALALVSDKALSKTVRVAATNHLAGLAIEIAEIKSFSTDDYIQRMPVDIDMAIQLYARLVDVDNSATKQIEALYQLARAYDFNGNTDLSIQQMEKIESLSSAYALRDEILFRMGEAQFGLGDYELASLNYFNLSETYPESIFINNSNYMLGWSYFKQAEYDLALNHFFKLVDKFWYEQETGQDAEQRLIEDTLRVIGMTFANMDGANSVKQFFAKLGDKPYGERIYADLGEYYEDKLRYTDAATTFESILELYPDSDIAPFYQSRVVKAYIEGKFPSKAWPAKEVFVQNYGKDSQRWIIADESHKAKILEFLPDYLVDLAKRDHAKAQKSKSDEEFNDAIAWYDHYLAVAPNLINTPEIYFLRGEALTETERYQIAADSYQQAAYEFEEYERADEAAYAALLSYQKLYNQTKGQKQRKWLELGIEQSERFVATFDSPDYRPLVQTKLAEDMLLREDNEKALLYAEGLINQGNDIFTLAMQLRLWRVAAHASYEVGQFAKSEINYQTAIDLASDQQEIATLKKRKVESIYRQGEVAQAEIRYADAVVHFLRVGSEYPDSEIRVNAEFDAATVLIIMEDWDKALSVLTKFNKLYPKHELQGLMLEKLVIVYENTQKWGLAAQTLNTIYKREGNSTLGQNALWRSASLQEKAGDGQKAIDLFKLYVKTFPLPLEPASEARNEMHKIYVSRGDIESSEYWLNQNINQQDKYNSQSTGRTIFLASESSLIMGRKDYKEFGEIKLKLPLETSLSKKQKFMEQSMEHLSKTLDYGLADHSTEATALMGDLYSQLASSLMSSERPAELNALELEQYELLLEEQVFPFEDQALELYEVNVGWIRQEIYTPWVQYSLDQLKEILPARYDKPEEVPVYADSIQ